MNFSVIIPAYNAERFLGEAIESVLRQTEPPSEVLVVNDGSSDGTERVARSFGSRVALISQANAGVAAARNVGAARAAHEWLAFLDADDAWRPEKLAYQKRVLREESSYSCLTQIQHASSTLEPRELSSGTSVDLRAMIFHAPDCAPTTPSSLVVARRLFDQIRGFDSRFQTLADWDLVLRLRLAGPMAFVNEPLVLYRRHDSNMSRAVALLDRETTVLMDKIFGELPLPHHLTTLERAARAYNDRVVAASLWVAGDRRTAALRAMRCAFRSPREGVALIRRFAASWGK